MFMNDGNPAIAGLAVAGLPSVHSDSPRMGQFAWENRGTLDKQFSSSIS